MPPDKRKLKRAKLIERVRTVEKSRSALAASEAEALRLHRRLKPFRRVQLRWRGRMAQSMAEHETVVAALRSGDAATAADTLRDHVAVQGEKFHQLMASLRTAAQ